jgi:hypothetical protein
MTPVPLWLDHASLAVPDLHRAIAELDARFGLHATISPADPRHHGRIHFNRSYLEVSSQDPVAEWRLPLFFLRFADPGGLRRHLAAADLAFRFEVYQGVDGRWDDVTVDGGSVPLPILVRRTHPFHVAQTWPPPLAKPHRCGATTLEAVHVCVCDLGPAMGIYSRLVGGKVLIGAVNGVLHAEVRLTSGKVVLQEGEETGIAGIVLGVHSLPAAAAFVGPPTRSAVSWFDPITSHGLKIGFAEATGILIPDHASP